MAITGETSRCGHEPSLRIPMRNCCDQENETPQREARGCPPDCRHAGLDREFGRICDDKPVIAKPVLANP